MQLFKRQKSFSEFFFAFFKFRSIFKQFEKKDDPHILCTEEITNSERRD